MINTNDTKSEKGYWQKPNNYVRIATLAAVAIYTAVQIYQTNLIHSNNVVSQRAFVYTGTPEALTVIDPGNKTTKKLAIVFKFVNSGNTPCPMCPIR